MYSSTAPIGRLSIKTDRRSEVEALKGTNSKCSLLGTAIIRPQRSAAPSKEPEADSLNYAANLKADANEAAGGGDPGSGGHEKRIASPTILSDPQTPHRCRAEEEIILQFSQ
jgi:hypothetical protein